MRFLRANHPGLSPFLATSLALMAEMAAGAASPFAPYLATLPPNCPDCLLHWTDQEKQDLKGGCRGGVMGVSHQGCRVAGSGRKGR